MEASAPAELAPSRDRLAVPDSQQPPSQVVADGDVSPDSQLIDEAFVETESADAPTVDTEHPQLANASEGSPKPSGKVRRSSLMLAGIRKDEIATEKKEEESPAPTEEVVDSKKVKPKRTLMNFFGLFSGGTKNKKDIPADPKAAEGPLTLAEGADAGVASSAPQAESQAVVGSMDEAPLGAVADSTQAPAEASVPFAAAEVPVASAIDATASSQELQDSFPAVDAVETVDTPAAEIALPQSADEAEQSSVADNADNLNSRKAAAVQSRPSLSLRRKSIQRVISVKGLDSSSSDTTKVMDERAASAAPAVPTPDDRYPAESSPIEADLRSPEVPSSPAVVPSPSQATPGSAALRRRKSMQRVLKARERNEQASSSVPTETSEPTSATSAVAEEEEGEIAPRVDAAARAVEVSAPPSIPPTSPLVLWERVEQVSDDIPAEIDPACPDGEQPQEALVPAEVSALESATTPGEEPQEEELVATPVVEVQAPNGQRLSIKIVTPGAPLPPLPPSRVLPEPTSVAAAGNSELSPETEAADEPRASVEVAFPEVMEVQMGDGRRMSIRAVTPGAPLPPPPPNTLPQRQTPVIGNEQEGVEAPSAAPAVEEAPEMEAPIEEQENENAPAVVDGEAEAAAVEQEEEGPAAEQGEEEATSLERDAEEELEVPAREEVPEEEAPAVGEAPSEEEDVAAVVEASPVVVMQTADGRRLSIKAVTPGAPPPPPPPAPLNPEAVHDPASVGADMECAELQQLPLSQEA